MINDRRELKNKNGEYKTFGICGGNSNGDSLRGKTVKVKYFFIKVAFICFHFFPLRKKMRLS